MTNETELRHHEKSNNSFKTKFKIKKNNNKDQVKKQLKIAKTKIQLNEYSNLKTRPINHIAQFQSMNIFAQNYKYIKTLIKR